MKVTKQKLGEYVYKATNLATIAGGLLLGHGLGQVAASRGDASDWIELATGLIVTSGSLIYRFKTMDRYDPQIRGIRNEISRTEGEICRLEGEICRLEGEISPNQEKIRETEQEILRTYSRPN